MELFCIDNDARRLMVPKEFFIFIIYIVPVVDPGNIDAAKYHILPARSRSCQDPVYIVQCLAHMFPNTALADFSGIQIQGKLSGDIQRVSGNHSGNIMAFIRTFDIENYLFHE